MRLTSKPDVLRLQAKRDVDGLVQALGYRADAAIQDAASAALVALGEPALPSLIRALGTSALQASAKATLRRIGILSIHPLINALKTDERESVRVAAAKTLADIGMFSIEPLIGSLRHRSPEVRGIALKTLIEIGPLAVEPLIAQLAEKDYPAIVRIEILKALAQFGNTQATSALLSAAQNDPLAEVRDYAATALGLHDLLVKPLTPEPQQVETNKPRGLSRAFRDKDARDAAVEKKDKTNVDVQRDAGEALSYRWSRVRQMLPRLQAIPFDVLQNLLRTHSVHRGFSNSSEVLEDLDREFTQYSRLRDSSYAESSIRLVFDNEVAQGSNVMPATRQLEVIIVRQQHQYFEFFTATYLEHYW